MKALKFSLFALAAVTLGLTIGSLAGLWLLFLFV
jgi:hypothetical protein